MKEFAYAVCYADPNPLACRTGFTVMTTHRTFAGARHKYSCTTGAGYYIAHKIPGMGYMRMTEAEMKTAAKGGADALNAEALAQALRAVLRMDVNGHALQDRLQFSTPGRAILEQARAALGGAL